MCKEFEEVLNTDYMDKRSMWRKVKEHSWISWYGDTIKHIEHVKEMDVWVAHYDEYSNIIKYCPFCGKKL